MKTTANYINLFLGGLMAYTLGYQLTEPKFWYITVPMCCVVGTISGFFIERMPE